MALVSRLFPPHPVTHLLIDLDGTLLGNKGVRLSLAFARRSLSTLRTHGSLPRVTKSLLAIAREMKRTPSGVANDRRLVERFARSMNLEIEEAATVLRDALRTVFPSLDTYFYPLSGAPEFLEWAKRRYTLVLATNPAWPREIVELRVRWAGIDPGIFTFITDAREMSAFKPDPRYFRQILKHEGLRPEQCLFIGNEGRMDLPATRVGIPVFIITKSRRVGFFKQPRTRAPAAKGSFETLRTLLEGA